MNTHLFLFKVRDARVSGAPIETEAEETSEAQQVTRDLRRDARRSKQ